MFQNACIFSCVFMLLLSWFILMCVFVSRNCNLGFSYHAIYSSWSDHYENYIKTVKIFRKLKMMYLNYYRYHYYVMTKSMFSFATTVNLLKWKHLSLFARYTMLIYSISNHHLHNLSFYLTFSVTNLFMPFVHFLVPWTNIAVWGIHECWCILWMALVTLLCLQPYFETPLYSLDYS